MNQADIDGMKEVFDFDPHKGPHPYESQEEFDQRIQMRDDIWTALEIVVVGWIKNKFIEDPYIEAAPRRMKFLKKFGLIISVKVKNWIVWEPTQDGISYYFSDKHCD